MIDNHGLTMTTSSPTAQQRYLEGLDLALSQNYGAEEKFQEAIEADEGFALAHAGLGFLLMLQVAVPQARASVDKARSLSAGITRRERQHVEAMAHFVYGENAKAYAVLREHMAEFPQDAFMLRLAQRLFVLGCSGAGVGDYPPVFFNLIKSLEPVYGDDWAFMGTSAWAHHEVGLMAEGMDLAQRSLDLRPDNSVAAHSVAHVLFETGEHRQGSDFLSPWLERLDRRARYRVHLSWHQALFDLANGRYDAVLSRYENDIRPSVAAKRYDSLSDSASLFWRMHIYGNDTPPVPWEELLAIAAPAAQSPGPAFRDAHAALVFAVAGDDESLDRVISRLQEAASKGNALAEEATLPLVRGIQAFAHGDYAAAAAHMEPVHPQLSRVGGSHAQREVFEDTLLEAYLRAGWFDKAEDLLGVRLRQRETARDTFWLGRALSATGRTEEAQSSFDTAKRRWDGADQDFAETAALDSLAAQTR